jgi:hypothetical protein
VLTVSPAASRSEIIREALRARHHEPFERALGRATRKLDAGYDEYLAIISEVREYARTHKMDLREAARALAD